MFKRRQTTLEGATPNADSVLVRVFGAAVGGVLLFLLEIVQIVVIAAAIIIPIRYFLVQPFYVRGASMEPTFLDREYLLIDEITYRFRDPQRGDVVVFRYPRDPSEFFIKRVIGVPGDTVDVANGKVVSYQHGAYGGIVLEEEYISVQSHRHRASHAQPDEYFLLGDNRPASLDSRSFGPVKSEYPWGACGCADCRWTGSGSLNRRSTRIFFVTMA